MADGQLDTLILPRVNRQCMQRFLDEVASRHPGERIVRVLDGAGWHRSDSLARAPNVRLLNLPPYSPKLNPVEHLWDDLREKSFHNRPPLRKSGRAGKSFGKGAPSAGT